MTQELLSQLLWFMDFTKGFLVCTHAMSTLMDDKNAVYMSNRFPSTLVFSGCRYQNRKQKKIVKSLFILTPVSVGKINCILQPLLLCISLIQQALQALSLTQWWLYKVNIVIYQADLRNMWDDHDLLTPHYMVAARNVLKLRDTQKRYFQLKYITLKVVLSISFLLLSVV